MNKNFTAIFFDYGGVIEVSDYKLMDEILKTLGITKEEWSAVYLKYNHLTNLENKEWKEVGLLVAEKLGADQSQLENIATLIDQANSSKVLNIELIDLIKKLKNLGLKTAIISNYTSTLRNKIQNQGIYALFDEIIISSEVGYQKPNSEIFEVAFGKLNVTAGQTVFIDDSSSSLSYANEIGYTPILYTNIDNLKFELSRILNTDL